MLPVTAQKIIQANTPQKIYGNSTLYLARAQIMDKICFSRGPPAAVREKQTPPAGSHGLETGLPPAYY